jgi:hypothetical protein
MFKNSTIRALLKNPKAHSPKEYPIGEIFSRAKEREKFHKSH